MIQQQHQWQSSCGEVYYNDSSGYSDNWGQFFNNTVVPAEQIFQATQSWFVNFGNW